MKETFRSSAKDAQTAAFAIRLQELCADMGLPAGRGLQTALAKQFGVSPNAARKWLKGEGYPETALAMRIAKWGGTTLAWLLQGQEPKSAAPIDSAALKLGEAVRILPPGDRREVTHYLRYKLQANATQVHAGERFRRYADMLAALDEEDDDLGAARRSNRR